MSANPKKAVRAAFPIDLSAGVDADGKAITVRPVTLAMWAALERIDSPLLPGGKPKDTLDLIPSLYLLTHDPREVFAGNVLDLAMQWADKLPVTALESIRAACARQLSDVAAVIPEVDEEDELRKKKRTAPSPTSSTSPAPPSDGPTGRPFSKRRSPSSRSSTGTTRSRPIKSSRSR